MSVGARVRTDPRISRRRRAVARSKRRRWAIAGISIAGVGVLGWAALVSPLLAVRHVRVLGGEHTSARDVAAAAGLSTDDKLLLVSTGAIARAAETLPWVRSAQVDKKLPGTIVVRVDERKPAMVLSLESDRWLVDRTGHVLARASRAPKLPILSGFDPGSVRAGERLTLPQARAALTAWRGLGAKLRGHVVAVFAPTPSRISLSLDTQTIVRYGSATALAAKNAVLHALLAREHGGSAPAYIDVRVPESPAVSVAPAVAAPSPGASPVPSATPSP